MGTNPQILMLSVDTRAFTSYRALPAHFFFTTLHPRNEHRFGSNSIKETPTISHTSLLDISRPYVLNLRPNLLSLIAQITLLTPKSIFLLRSLTHCNLNLQPHLGALTVFYSYLIFADGPVSSVGTEFVFFVSERNHLAQFSELAAREILSTIILLNCRSALNLLGRQTNLIWIHLTAARPGHEKKWR